MSATTPSSGPRRSARILPFPAPTRPGASRPAAIDSLLRGVRDLSRREDHATPIPDDLVSSVLSALYPRTA